MVGRAGLALLLSLLLGTAWAKSRRASPPIEPPAGEQPLTFAPPQLTELTLPVTGLWGVLQGFGTESHTGYATFALDFVPAEDRARALPLASRTSLSDFPCFGREVLALAPGDVVWAHDGEPDHPPFWPGRHEPGNFVIVQHGPHELTELRHLQRGSVTVKVGDRVARGQRLGRCGNSGNAHTPHVHLGLLGEVMPLATRPLRLARYEVLDERGRWMPGDGTPRTGQVLRSTIAPSTDSPRAIDSLPATRYGWRMARPASEKLAAKAQKKTGTKVDEKPRKKFRPTPPASDDASAQRVSQQRELDPWVEDEAALAALDARRPLALPTHHDRARLNAGPEGKPKPVRVLVIDVGGTNVKVLATGHTARRATPSGPDLTPEKMVKAVQALTRDWTFDVVSIGYPGPVVRGRIGANPAHLGDGWIGFDFEKAFGRPTLIINDAAMQALGSYQGGNMLFLGLGTGLGSALVAQGHLHPLELAHLPYRKGKTYEDYLGKRGLHKHGKKAWRKRVLDVAARLMAAMQADELVIGGGNASLLHSLPAHTRLGENANAFKGGFRLWGPPAPARR